MTTFLSDVDFKDWKIYALSESDYLSTYIFSYVGNHNLKRDKYMRITCSEEEGGIKSSVGSYVLCEIIGHLELESIIGLWRRVYNKASEQWEDIYSEEYNKIDPKFEPMLDKEDPKLKTLATINTNERFNKNNVFGIYSLDTEKEKYSFCESTIKLNPKNKDLDNFYKHLKNR